MKKKGGRTGKKWNEKQEKVPTELHTKAQGKRGKLTSREVSGQGIITLDATGGKKMAPNFLIITQEDYAFQAP